MRQPLIFLFFLLAQQAHAGVPAIFIDGFEQPFVAQPACVSGTAPTTAQGGDLGPAGANYVVITCLEIANDQPFDRSEVAFASIPVARSMDLGDADLNQLAVVGPGNRQIAAQFDVISRWGGPLADQARPIRWLEISVSTDVPGDSTNSYALVRYQTPLGSPDPFAASISPQGNQFVVDTGVARFTLDPSNPALFDQIDADPDNDGAGLQTIYSHTVGAGPFMTFNPGGADVTVDTAGNGMVEVDANGFDVIESGPAKVVVRLNGHLIDPGGASQCAATNPPYERFGYTLVATFMRGSRDALLQYQFRNECSSANGEPWDDEGVQTIEAGWRFPFTLGAHTVHHAGSGAVTGRAGFAGSTMVRQRRGGGTPWARRADVLFDGVPQETAEFFESPFVGLSDLNFLISLQMPWMQYREPQALTVRNQTLSVDVITEGLTVGEGKAIWNFALLGIGPASDLGSIEDRRARGRASVERGLLVRASRDYLAGAGVFPPLGDDSVSDVKTGYVNYMETFHDNTLGAQWERAKTYGSQLWPDVQSDDQFANAVNDVPADNNVSMNYWNASGAELTEFFRSGAPQWVWDFALPQSYLQTFTAYLNIFDKRHGRANGAAVNSGGAGEGHWHRNAFGSDDYTYNRGMAFAYVVRPNAAMRQRFAHAGQMVIDRYNVPRAQQATRDFFLSRVDSSRGELQHFENLANCAEFVPGAAGQACHSKLMELLDELALDNLRAGMICQGDIPDLTRCDWPQTFMITSMQYGFYLRMHLNYDDVLPAPTRDPLARMLREMPTHYYNLGMDPVGSSPTAFSEWAALLSCSIVNDQPGTCQRFDTGDGTSIIFQNRGHALALGLIAHWLDPSVGLCAASRQLLDELFDQQTEAPAGPLNGYLGGGGWFKGGAQVVQQLAFVVGLYDTQCQ